MSRKNKIVMILITILVLVCILLQIFLPNFSLIIRSGNILQSMAENNTESKKYINTLQEMWDFAEEVNNGNRFDGKTVYLTSDINLGCNEEKQWAPIDNFRGDFDGQGHTISGLYISCNGPELGLFATNKGNIKNLDISDSYIESPLYENSSAEQRVGILVAYNDGYINNCKVANSKIKTEAKGIAYVGGICGYNAGNIEYCENAADIYTEVISATGGIVGENYNYVSKCKNTGIIEGNDDSRYNSFGIAGIVGSNHSIVNLCANFGSIKSEAYTGGIVGTNFSGNTEIIASCNFGIIEGKTCGGIIGRNGSSSNASTTGGTIKNSFNAGKILSSNGGTICYSNKKGGKIQNCYYIESNLNICSYDSAEENTNAISKSADEMKKMEFVQLLNADGKQYEYKENDYPEIDIVPPKIEIDYNRVDSNKVIVSMKSNEYLRELLGWTIAEDKQTLTKTFYINYSKEITVEDYNYNQSTIKIDINTLKDSKITQQNYYINNFEDLQTFAQEVNNGNNLEGKKVYLINNINIPQNYIWDVIGDSEHNAFAGDFYGNGKKISGIKINEYSYYKGLFGYVKNAHIESIEVSGQINGESKYTGGIVAINYGGYIRECVNNININEKFNVYDNNSYDIWASKVGGIAGYTTKNSKIITCINNGKIDYIGNSGASGSCGGIAGYAQESSIYYSANNADIITKAAYYTGGIVGELYYTDSHIENCYNKGNITINSIPQGCGGIAGKVNVGSLINNYNLGNIKFNGTGTINKIGGIVGETYNRINIENCYNVGQVDTAAIIGVVSSSSGTITNNYYLEDSASCAYYSSKIEEIDIIGKTEQEMQNQDFVNLLNKNTLVWQKDVEKVNKGYPIIVAPIINIEVTTLPSKTDYLNGENFNAEGMIVTVTYDDESRGKTEDYTILNGQNLNCLVNKVEIQSNENPKVKTEVEITVGHSFTKYTSNNDATCTKDGTKTSKCDRCDETKTVADVGSKKPHTEVIDKKVEATCTTTGLTEGKHCSVCNTVTVEQKEIPALGHNYKAIITNPTCIEKGYTMHTCQRCQESYKDTYTEALGHSFTNYISNNDATCTKDGTKTAKCDRCNESKTVTDVGSKKPHNFQNGKCTICGKEEPKITLTTNKYKILVEYITKIPHKTTFKTFKTNIITNAEQIKLFDKSGKELGETDIIGTGMTLTLKLGTRTNNFKLVVSGDVTGDGKADFKDIVLINKHRLHKKALEGEYLMAAEVTEDGEVDFKDIVKLNKFRLNKIIQLFSII